MAERIVHTSEGKVGDVAVHFDYECFENRKILKIRSSEPGSPTEVDANDILAAIKKSNGDGNEAILMYLGPAFASSPDVIFKKEIFTNVPKQFLEDNLISLTFSNGLTGPQTRTKHHIIVSIGSGTAQAQLYYESVIKPLYSVKGLSQPYELLITENENSITNYTRSAVLPEANKGVPQTILLLSGDGGVVDILNVLGTAKHTSQYVNPVLGLVPMGTGNALANSIGVNKDRTKGLRPFLQGRPYPLPAFSITFSSGSKLIVNEGKERFDVPSNTLGELVLYGAVVCSWALHASLVADSDTTEYRKYGSERFAMAAKELLAPTDGSAPHNYQAKITLFRRDKLDVIREEVMAQREHGYVLATLVSNLEENLTISPLSKPFDGQLRLLHLNPMPSANVMSIMGLAYKGGKHVADTAAYYEEIEGLKIDFEEEEEKWRRVCVDGKIVGVEKGGWIELRQERRLNSILEVMSVTNLG